MQINQQYNYCSKVFNVSMTFVVFLKKSTVTTVIKNIENRNIRKYYYNLKQMFFTNVICLCDAKLNSPTDSSLLSWCSSYDSYYYQSWKQWCWCYNVEIGIKKKIRITWWIDEQKVKKEKNWFEMVFVFNDSFEQFNVSLLNYFFKNLNSSEYAAKKKKCCPWFSIYRYLQQAWWHWVLWPAVSLQCTLGYALFHSVSTSLI